MKIIYKRLPNNRHQLYNRELQRHYNFYCYTDSKQNGKDSKGVKIFAKKIGGTIIKGHQANHPLRKPIY